MALRLTHVLLLMVLVLAAGVLSVQGLERDHAVQGTLVIAAPGLTALDAQALQQERSDARWALVPAGDGPLAPFDEALVADRIGRGAVTSLFIQPPQPALPPSDERAAWRVLIAPQAGDVLASAAAFVAAQSGTRPFLAGLILPPSAENAQLPELLAPLLAAAETLPSFRRTSVVLLGARNPESGTRVVVRLDRGGGARPGPVLLTDLLERDR